MRAVVLLSLTPLLCGFSAAAFAAPNTLCDYQLRYDITVDGDSLLMRKAEAAPEVRIVGDRLWVGAEQQLLSTIERQRLGDYHAELAVFVANVAQLALEGLQFGIDSAVSAIAAATGADNGGPALMRRFDGLRSQLSSGLDGRHLPAQMLGRDFDHALDTAIDQITEQAVAEMSRDSAERLAMSPLPSRLQARAVDRLLETHAEPGGRMLERRADALCGQLQRLDALENLIGRFNAFDRNLPSI
jgi:hypothetical protein